MSVAAVLLAAGEARRFGAPKQLATLEGVSLVRRAARTALASRADPVYVVVGAHADAVVRELEDLPVAIVPNEDWREGMASSIRAGVQAAAAAAPRTDGVLLLLADQVRVTRALLDELVRRFEEGEADLLACRYDGTTGPPALFARSHLPALEALEGDVGARAILRATPGDRLSCVPFPDGSHDVDLPEDLERARPG